MPADFEVRMDHARKGAHLGHQVMPQLLQLPPLLGLPDQVLCKQRLDDLACHKHRSASTFVWFPEELACLGVALEQQLAVARRLIQLQIGVMAAHVHQNTREAPRQSVALGHPISTPGWGPHQSIVATGRVRPNACRVSATYTTPPPTRATNGP